MITFFKRTITSKSLKIIPQIEKGCWVYVVNPDQVELSRLTEEYKLDSDLVEEGLDDNELPRLDMYEYRTYIFAKVLSSQPNKLVTILMILGDDFILTISKEELTLLSSIEKSNIPTTQKLKFLINLFMLTNDAAERSVVKVVKNVQSKKRDPNQLSEDDMETLLEQEDFLNNLVSTYFYTNILYTKIVKKLKFSEDEKVTLEDLTVETQQGLNLCKTSLKTISNVRNVYSIILSNKLNRSIKFLTIFTIFVSIPAAISSLYGMNVTLPFQSNPYLFGYIVLGIISIWVLFTFILKKKEVI